MRYAPFAGFIGAGMMTLATVTAPALAHSAKATLSTDEIIQALRGKICVTKAGAKLTFGRDGLYAYDGLWANGGRYSVNDGVITVILDNGLERSFAITRKDDVFYMEQTALSCERLDLSRAQ